MPGNKEEKQKCFEKLTQMQKYLPFLDFMIDKIEKKNNECSLKCQLTKFKVLRSMIAEKSGKYSWKVIVKVEDIIEKLISKLDFKDQYEKSKQCVTNTDNNNQKISTSVSVSVPPSTPTVVFMTTPSGSQTTAPNLKQQQFSSNTVDLIMKTLKVSVDNSMKKNMEGSKELPSSLGSSLEPFDASESTIETDLDKDLDGFDLTDCQNLSDSETSSSAVERVSAVTEKAPSHDDLLSSSREKLLKSLQSRLLPCKSDLGSPKSPVVNKTEKLSDSQSISASSRTPTNLSERKSSSDFSESSDHNGGERKNRKAVDVPGVTPGTGGVPVALKSFKPFSFPAKVRSDSAVSPSDASLKERLKKKFSTDICEVYRVPGRSVGGSLRSLKESKDHKKGFSAEEDDLFKPDKITEKSDSKRSSSASQLKSTEKKDSQAQKPHRDQQVSRKHDTSCKDDKTVKKHDEQNCKGIEMKLPKSEPFKKDKNQESQDTKEGKKPSDKKESEEKGVELDKLNDDELLKFVKENMQYLPHLSKLKPSELRKVIRSSALGNLAALELDYTSEISDDSFHDPEELTNSGAKNLRLQLKPKKSVDSTGNTDQPHPLATLKIAQVGSDGVAKNVKPIVEPSTDTKLLDEVGDRTHDMDDVSENNNQDEEDYAQRLIDETTPSPHAAPVPASAPLPPPPLPPAPAPAPPPPPPPPPPPAALPFDKKRLLELPMPIVEDLFDDISSIESFDTSNNASDNGNPRLSLPKFSEKKNGAKGPPIASHQLNAETCKSAGGSRTGPNGRANPYPPRDNNKSVRPQTSIGHSNAPIADSYRAHRFIVSRPEFWPSVPYTSHGPQDVTQYPQSSGRYPNDSSDIRNSGTHTKFPVMPSPITSSRRHSYGSIEPKSYAEYKRMKLREQEKSSQLGATVEESSKSNLADPIGVSEMSRSPAERDDTSKKPADPRRSKDPPYSKQSNSKSYHFDDTRRRPLHSGQRRFSDHMDNRGRDERKGQEEIVKVTEEKRHSAESEELVSPLEELYRDESKPKTGRGYGIQHFKIPKKVRETTYQGPSKPNESQAPTSCHNAPTDEGKTHASNTQKEADVAKESKESAPVQVDEPENQSEGGSVVEETRNSRKSGEKSERNNISNLSVTKDIRSRSTLRVESSKTVTKTESSITRSDSANREGAETCDSKAKVNRTEVTGEETAKPASEPAGVGSNTGEGNHQPAGQVKKVESKGRAAPNRTKETARETLQDAEKEVVTKSEKPKGKASSAEKTVKKCEAQVVECDSSMANSDQNAGIESLQVSDKSATVSKEEITQEFVEALIRKSFQSGEGKLLLAHAKLFEEFARKLNSKKLKTIQKIINSETDSSSSSAEIFSEDEKKRKKGKKSEEKSQKNKRTRRRVRRSKRQKSSSSSCLSCESEDTSEDETCDKKEDKTEIRESEATGSGGDEESRSQLRSAAEETRCKSSDSAIAKGNKKIKKRRKYNEFGKNFSGRKAKRKQRQKKLLEQILNETPQTEPSQDLNASGDASGDASGRGSEPRSRPKTKGKVKTELDRLHDDIRSMFLNAGVVTPTGQRMCRILKQSGGKIKNMDIVKESAKMVEEEKLKKVHTRRPASKNSRSDSRSRSQSLDKTSKTVEAQPENEDAEDPKLEKGPRVVLQRVDLENFGYGVKIADGCISFRRMKGRNTAIKRVVASRAVPDNGSSSADSLEKNVFLLRNKRKVERMRKAKCKKEYSGKKLIDVVKCLPLRMAKMKHLQICEKKQQEMTKRRKYSPGRLPKRNGTRKNKADLEFSNAELLNYAFERIRVMYSCKLCSQVTRYITGHYKAVHPDHEVLISRLCVGEAKKAKLDAKRNRYENPSSGETSLAESMKRKMKTLLTSSDSYNCRMCSSMKTQDLEVFKAHVSSHTGEFRFQCPAEGCSVRTYSFQDMKIHFLTKHGKNKAEYNKVNELYTIVVEENKMFGFLCSICNYVQLCRRNVIDHISRRHAASEDPGVLKINMSANLTKAVKKGLKDGKSKAKDISRGSDGAEKFGEEAEVVFRSKIPEVKEADEKEGKEKVEEVEFRNMKEDYVSTPERKNVFLVEDGNEPADEEGEEDEDEEEEDEEQGEEEEEEEELGNNKVEEDEDEAEKSPKTTPGDPLHEEKMNLSETGHEMNLCTNDIEMESCMDIKKMSILRGEDVVGSVETSEQKDERSGQETVGASQKLKVGPLEAQLLEDSTVLYECYVKGCLFFTRAYDLFEKHIKISHSKTKWNGHCEICNAGKDVQPSGDNSFKLLTALRHLKLHEREKVSDGKLSKEDIITELKLLNSPHECVMDDEDTDKTEKDAESPVETKEEVTPMTKKTENAESPYPPKPLLRVRNLLGDRLSTPKESSEENEMVSIKEELPSAERPANSMFTIENVRSLNDAPAEDTEIQIQHVCSLKDSPTSLPQLASGKTILVRSCPTRKIAIRPEPSAVSIDVGQLSVVQAPTATHPVVLAPLTTTSPIRIISSSSLTSKSKFTVKPILVPAESGRINSRNVLSIISPTLSPVVSNAPASAEATCISQAPVLSESTPTNQSVSGSKSSIDVTVVAPSKPAPPAATTSTSTSALDVEDVVEKDTVTLQRIHPSPNVGNKRVKDAKIYEEMLTKTKLCHLFKCMGIECSFTCNNECVFRQHIGLHEAQRRLKKNKGIRTIFLRLANKTTRAFYWQQCAYCCELLTNTNNALSQHVLEEHGHCMYQCAFCFYRAVSHSYVEIHQNLAHSQILKTTPRVIYKCKPLRTPPSQSAALEKHGRRQSVRPYHCDQCGRKFFITQDFINHLTTQHQSVTAYTCHICKNLCFKADRLVVHYKLHSYCTYQCAYCLHGTETEKEMVFHLCNFHFSQPAVMYVRAFAEGQSHDVKEKQMKKKKHLSNQLDSLKVIVYESDTLSADCIVEVDADEDTSENANTDLSAIVAELGINADVQSPPCVTPLMKELASIGDKNTKNLTVKTLLPNAQFSSENENGTENCSVLISSGLSTPSDQSHDRAMNIPLGQLPLEIVNVQHNESPPAPPPPKTIASPDRNLKLNEIIVNLQNKDKGVALPSGGEEERQPPVISSAIHKLPPVVLSRGSFSKNVYPSKSAMIKKKSEEPSQGNESSEGDEHGAGECPKSSGEGKERNEPSKDNIQGAADRESSTKPASSSCAELSGVNEKSEKSKPHEAPLITSVVSLADSEFGKEAVGGEDSSLVISEICSLPTKPEPAPSGIVINIQPTVNSPSVLKPPIIRVEDFPVGEGNKVCTQEKSGEDLEPEKKDGDKECEKPDEVRPGSPDVIILEEEKTNDIITVTLDSDDEKDENHKKGIEKNSIAKMEPLELTTGGDTIRKEMERLRNQIASETDSLLFDEADGEKPKVDLSLTIEPGSEESSTGQTLLSPIEEAICSLNKKLQSETEQAQKKEEEEEEEEEEVEEEVEEEEEEEESKRKVARVSPNKSESASSELPERPRTRFAARDRKKEGCENAEKSDGDDSNSKKEDTGRCKKTKEDLTGKELFICGNENCNFAADNDFALKDHLYVCDLSRASSVLMCPHCSRQMKQFHAYLEHLKYHGQKKYHCGLCDYSSPVDSNVSRHVKQKHKCVQLKVLPKDSQPGHLVYYPKNYKVDKVDFEVNGYSPGDEDKLPLQSVYQVNVKCAKCPYFTKVRSNMVRHLKIHVKSVETEGVVVVPSTAPTNPVPCLESKERMFDKMTNLAASSQIAQAKEKAMLESLPPEEAAKLPQFVAEQMRYKCCLPDCNYITVDDGMLKHHIKALHDEINYYSCPHCQDTVHVDVRHVTLDKIGHHLKHHDSKLYKCPHCIYFHYQKNMVEKHTVEKHPDRRYFVHTVREPKHETASEEDGSSSEGGPRVWKCALCEGFRSPSKSNLMDHLLKSHNIKSKYRCKLCPMKGNSYQAFLNHFASKHPGEEVSFMKVYLSERVSSGNLESGNSSGADSSSEHFDTTPLWQRGTPRIRHIRGILIEEEEIKTKKIKRSSLEENEAEAPEQATVNENAFYCPLCTNKKKPFFTRSEDCFRTHLYQELNYQQFACILCGKMFVDRKDFDRHHTRVHPDKSPSMKQTKEDNEIKFWVDQVIAKRRQQMEDRKRKLSDGEASGSQAPPKKKKEV